MPCTEYISVLYIIISKNYRQYTATSILIKGHQHGWKKPVWNISLLKYSFIET